MSSFNRVILMGNLARDCDVRWATNGNAVVANTIVTNRKWSDETGNPREEVAFIDITIFGKRGEAFAQYLRKGSPVLIEGRIVMDQWEDKQTRAKRTKLKVVVDNFSFTNASTSGPAHVEQTEAQPSDDEVPY